MIYLQTFRKFGTMKQALTQRIMETIKPIHFQIEDQSKYHSRGLQTHFKMLIVAKQFEGLSKIKKQQIIYNNLQDLMPKIHALTLTCQTPQESQVKQPNQSPGCISKKK